MAELKKIARLVNSANNQLFMSLKTGTFTSINVIYYILIHLFYINPFCVTLELLYTGLKLNPGWPWQKLRSTRRLSLPANWT